jgi:hypothetical protein
MDLNDVGNWLRRVARESSRAKQRPVNRRVRSASETLESRFLLSAHVVSQVAVQPAGNGQPQSTKPTAAVTNNPIRQSSGQNATGAVKLMSLHGVVPKVGNSGSSNATIDQAFAIAVASQESATTPLQDLELAASLQGTDNSTGGSLGGSTGLIDNSYGMSRQAIESAFTSPFASPTEVSGSLSLPILDSIFGTSEITIGPFASGSSESHVDASSQTQAAYLDDSAASFLANGMNSEVNPVAALTLPF